MDDNKLKIKRNHFEDKTKDLLDAACQTLIDVARENPNGECWALIRAADDVTGETFQIAVRKEG